MWEGRRAFFGLGENETSACLMDLVILKEFCLGSRRRARLRRHNPVNPPSTIRTAYARAPSRLLTSFRSHFTDDGQIVLDNNMQFIFFTLCMYSTSCSSNRWILCISYIVKPR